MGFIKVKKKKSFKEHHQDVKRKLTEWEKILSDYILIRTYI